MASLSEIAGCADAQPVPLTRRGQPPLVLTSGVLIGRQASADLFERTYDDYRARVAQVYGRPVIDA